MAPRPPATILGYLWPAGGVLTASLLIAWATEVLSFFLSRGLAFAVLALLQVLPEFAVEAVITRSAAADPSQLQYVTANFTGANRLIVGLFVPMVFFIAAYQARQRKERLHVLELPQHSSIEVIALIVPTLYSFTFVMRGSISLADSVILVGMYITYLMIAFRLPPEDENHADLPLVARTIRHQTVYRQKWIILLMFLLGGGLLYVSVHPFYENTLHLGVVLGISSYFLLQWMAPFLSEFPEFITILYWGKTGRATLGLTNAISSKVNQWTLLIAMIPIVYGYSTWQFGGIDGFRWSIQFDESQKLEVLLTAAQGLFAAACFLNLRFHRWEALTILGLWAIQLFDPLIDPLLPQNLPHFFEPSAGMSPHFIREWTTVIYLVLTPFVVFVPKNRFAALRGFAAVFREFILRKPAPAAPLPPGPQPPTP